MTLGEAFAYAVTAAGGGAAWKAIGKFIDWRKAREQAEAKKAAAEAGVAVKALDLAEDAREDTRENATGWRKCEERCAELRTENRALSERMERLEKSVAEYAKRCDQLERYLRAEREAREAAQNALGNELQKVELLETQAKALIGELTELRDSIATQRPGDRTEADTDPPPASKLRIVEIDGTKKR